MISNIGFGTYFVFAACTTLAVPFVWFMVPETKGMKLEEVDALFEGRGLFPGRRQSVGTAEEETDEKGVVEQIESV